MRRLYFVPLFTALAFAPALFISTSAMAQNAGGQNDNSQLSKEERFYNGMREQLEVTDDAEWKALLPKIAKVQVLTRYARDLHDSRRAIERMRSFRSADPNSPPPYYLQDLADRAAEVRAAYENKDSHANTIKQALKGFREARDKADKLLSEELGKARNELRDLVTARQELTLIMTGLLD
jgi:hypothetical protein